VTRIDDHGARPSTANRLIVHRVLPLLQRGSVSGATGRFSLVLLTVALAVVLLAPGSASAAFTRSFVRQITGPIGEPFSGPPEAAGAPFGVAVDAADNLWVSEYKSYKAPFQLDEFEGQSNVFLRTLDIEGLNPPENSFHEPEGLTFPQVLAINRATGSFYTFAGQTINSDSGFVEEFENDGTYVRRFRGNAPGGGELDIAVDNSSGSSSGSIYLTVEDEFVEKLNANGEAADFVNGKGEPTNLPYVQGNRIIGAPAGVSGCERTEFGTAIRAPGNITVDSQGDIYTVANDCLSSVPAILEYRPSGEFVRAIYGSETPGIGDGAGAQRGGFGANEGGTPASLAALAFDPANDHLLVSLDVPDEEKGAIDEFDGSSGKFVDQITEGTAGVLLKQPSQMAVDSLGDLYVVEPHEHAVIVYGRGENRPSVRLDETSERKSASAVLNGSVDPEGLDLSDCHFEYVTETAFAVSGFENLASGGVVPCIPGAASLQADDSYQAVHAEVKSLSSGTTYRYRLLATSEGAHGGTSATQPLAFTAPDQPRIDTSSAENISSTFVDLSARIDPRGAQTTYEFQYVQEASYNAQAANPYEAGTSVPVPAAAIGEGGHTGTVEASVQVHIGALVPGTAYRFRVVASNEIGTADGLDQSFTTLAAPVAGLADGRAYELLTPPDKGSAADMFAQTNSPGEYRNEESKGQSSETGDEFLLEARSAFGPFPASFFNASVFSRGAAGWTFDSLASPTLGVQSINHPLVEPFSFSRVAFTDDVGPAGEGSYHTTALVGSPGGPYTTMEEMPLPPIGGLNSTLSNELTVIGASHDMSHVVFLGETTASSAAHPACPGAAGQDLETGLLCEWSDGALKLVNVNKQGTLLNPCGAIPGENDGYSDSGGAHNVMSSDGSKIFFTAPDPRLGREFRSFEPEATRGCWDRQTNKNTPQVYMRANGATVQISAPEAGVSEAGKAPVQYPVAYSGASEDGSKVYFVTKTELTKDDEGIHDRELYEYDTETGALTRVSAGESDKASANVIAVPAISADGSAVYFMSHAQLTADAPEAPETETEAEDKANLYRYDSVTRQTTYVATIYANDAPALNAFSWHIEGAQHQLAPWPARSWYSTPDGRYLLFATSAELNGYHTAGEGCSRESLSAAFSSPGHCAEVYRYDSQGGGLVCVSCSSSGTANSDSLFGRSAKEDGPAAGQVRAMSDDGSYVFFDTADALAPQDGNGTLDVYEWHEGRVSLISSGTDAAPSFFLGTSASGHDVFFGTHAKLVPQDIDSAGDLYDARICTASEPCIAPSAGETAQCEGDACQTPAPSPIDSTPGSLTFSGLGNVVGEVVKPQKKVVKPKKKAKPVKCKVKRGKGTKTKECKKVKRVKRVIVHETKGGRRAGR
jgi:hypothetical protein